MLILKPKGRGNWREITFEIKGKRAAPILVRVGQFLPLGGIVWRVCAVLP